MRRDIDRQCPEQGDPEFGVTCAHPAVRPSKEQSNACKPDIRVAGEVRNETSHNQREGGPVRDATRAQVVQAEEERVQEQPGHWLWMIGEFGWGCGDGVGLLKSNRNTLSTKREVRRYDKGTVGVTASGIDAQRWCLTVARKLR